MRMEESHSINASNHPEPAGGPAVKHRDPWKPFRQGWPWRRITCLILAGVALGLAFPLPGWFALAWLAPGGILLAGLGTRGRAAWLHGWLAGFAFALFALRWLLNIPFPAGALAGWIALSAYVGSYVGVWNWFCQETLARCLTSPASSLPSEGEDLSMNPGLPSVASIWNNTPWGRRSSWILGCAVCWVAGEWLMARLFTGFPWLPVGMSQLSLLPLVQLGSLGGPYLVSFFVVWSSIALLGAGLSIAGIARAPVSSPLTHPRPTILGPGPSLFSRPAGWLADLALPGMALVLAFAWGWMRIQHYPKSERTVKVALIQPSIPQLLIWDRKEDGPRFQKMIELSRLALAARPDVLVWPEAALPSFSQEHFETMTRMAAEARVWMVFGADDAEPVPGNPGREAYRYYNAAFLLDRSGSVLASYRKRRLVIFGEYVPLAQWLPFLNWLTPIGTGFEPGRRPGHFTMPDLSVRMSMSICFEDVFPHSTRAAVEEETDWILNLTNNGWFGESSAQWQHAMNAAFRALENGRPVIRATNNGLTCWIDPLGRMHEVQAGSPKDVYGPGFKIAEVGVWPGKSRSSTGFRRWGDLWGGLCVGMTALQAMPLLRPRRNRRN